MRGKILWASLGLAALVVLTAGVVVGLQWQTQRHLDRAVEAVQAALPAGVVLRIGSAEIGLFERAVDASDVVFDDARPNGTAVTIGHLRLEGLDSDVDQGFRFRHIEVRDVELTDSGDRSRAVIDGASADAVDLPVDALTPDPAGLARIGLGAAALTGLKLTAPDGGLELAGLSVASLHGGLLGVAALNGLHIGFPDHDRGQVDMTLGAVACTDIAVVALLDGSYATQPRGAVGGCRLADIVVATPQGKGTLRSGRLAITARDDQGRPISSEGDIQGLTLDLPQFARLTGVLARLGAPDLTLSVHAEEHADPASRTAVVTEICKIDHAGDFGLDLALGNVPDPASLGASSVEAVPAAEKMTLGPVRIDWTDRGLIAALEAELLGDAAAIERLPAQAEIQLRDALKDLGVAETTGDWPTKLAAFLRQPGRIELRLAPVKAVEIGTLLDESLPPAAKFGLLQPSLTVETKP